jgi:DNA mismatch endonuclease (patch repair protein)
MKYIFYIVTSHHKNTIFLHSRSRHLNNCKYGRVRPATNAAFWQNKRLGNKQRDRKNLKALKSLGWKVLVIWECQLKDMAKIQNLLQSFLSRQLVPYGILSKINLCQSVLQSFKI